MKALVAPDPRTAFAYYERIVAAKHSDYSARVAQLRGRVEEAYSSYWGRRGSLEQLEPLSGLSQDERKLLAECYDGPKRAVEPLRELMEDEIWARQSDQARGECQLCGLDMPKTFDHYLPKAVFHEFAVCAFNLVPCCYDCNVNKGKRPWRRANERASLHLYFDEVEVDSAHLEAEIVERRRGYRVEYRLIQTAGSPFARRYELHCKTLDLLTRFEKRATGRLDTIRNDISDMSGYPLESVAQVFGRMAKARERALGANHWEAALYHAASRAHDFIARSQRDSEEPLHG